MLLDVREALEFKRAHMPGSINIPLSVFEDNLKGLIETTELLDKVTLVCKSGVRAHEALNKIKKLWLFVLKYGK